MSDILKRASGKTFLPDEFLSGHELCFLNHDVLAEMLRAGEAEGSFNQKFAFRDDADREAFEAAPDVFEWLERTSRDEDRAALLRRTVFPALLSDFLHFVYEALETSRKAKLNVTYALIRKPLQENLCLLETIATDRAVSPQNSSRIPCCFARRRPEGSRRTHDESKSLSAR